MIFILNKGIKTKLAFFSFALPLLGLTAAQSALSGPCEPELKENQQNRFTVSFKGCERKEATYELPLKADIQWVGFVSDRAFLVKAPACTDCAMKTNETLYLVHFDKGTPPMQLVAPGTVIDPQKNQKIFESRTFYGKCFSSKEPGVFVFQSDLIEKKRRKARQVASFLEIVPDTESGFAEKLSERRIPSIGSMKTLIKQRKCNEISGEKRVMSQFKLDTQPLTEEEDDEDDNRGTEVSDGSLAPASEAGEAPGAILAPARRKLASDSTEPKK